MFNFGPSSFARVFGVEVFGDHYEKWWWKLTIWPIYSVGSAVRNGIWWFRYRIDPNHRYHVIHTHLKPNYYDIDYLMLHGMFSLLRRYVEDEHDGVDALEKWGNELLGRDGEKDEFLREANERQGKKELEAVALYRWWMETYPAMLRRQEELDAAYQADEKRPLLTWEDEEPGLSRMISREDNESEAAIRVESDELDARIAREEQEMLHRLIDIRGGLWT